MKNISDFPADEGPHAGTMVEPFARSLFGADIAVTQCDPRATPIGLLSPERPRAARMVDKRLREFTAGRVAAHRAMARLGHPVQPVLPGPDRAPIWPEGLVGSLSHCDSLCLCAMGHARDYCAIGIDVEEDTPLEREMIDTICTAPELGWLSRQPESRRANLAKLLFSAKETAYKAQYPLSGEVLDFGAIAVCPDLEAGTFAATFTRPVGPFATGTVLNGRLARAHGLILTGMAMIARTGG